MEPRLVKYPNHYVHSLDHLFFAKIAGWGHDGCRSTGACGLTLHISTFLLDAHLHLCLLTLVHTIFLLSMRSSILGPYTSLYHQSAIKIVDAKTPIPVWDGISGMTYAQGTSLLP